MKPLFADRTEAGRRLAAEVMALNLERPVVCALARGGAPVGLEVAKALSAPFDLVLVRKIGVPTQPELAAGSIVDGERPDVIVNDEVVAASGMSAELFEAIAARELVEIERRRALYGAAHSPIPAQGRNVVLVDDGIATGASMRAAISAMRRRGAKSIIVAAPVAAGDTAVEVANLADQFICLATPAPFIGVGRHYGDFHQLTDEEVIALLARADAVKSRPIK